MTRLASIRRPPAVAYIIVVVVCCNPIDEETCDNDERRPRDGEHLATAASRPRRLLQMNAGQALEFDTFERSLQSVCRHAAVIDRKRPSAPTEDARGPSYMSARSGCKTRDVLRNPTSVSQQSLYPSVGWSHGSGRCYRSISRLVHFAGPRQRFCEARPRR